MAELIPFVVGPKSMHELLVLPQFGDFIDGDVTTPSTEDGDWVVMDDVTYQRPIIEARGQGNLLKRRDATCKLIYSPVGKLSNRYVRTEKIYAATEDCQEEFYQGCFEDYENQNWQMFQAKIMPMMDSGIKQDLFTNKYFGDITRPADPLGVWSWNKFDGVFTQYAKYIASGVIPSAQTFTIPSGTLTPQQGHDALMNAYLKRDPILKVQDKADMAFYVDSDLADAYEQWLVLSGYSSVADRMNGVLRSNLQFLKIEVRVKNWDGILAALNGSTAAHACILTMKANFLFATDKKYGGGPKRDQAIKVFYDEKDEIWRRTVHLKAGTEILTPIQTVFGMTSF